MPGPVVELCYRRSVRKGICRWDGLCRRVRSLNGLYLTTFDAQSIRVSKNSVAEVNRLRQLLEKISLFIKLQLHVPPEKESSPARVIKRCGPTTKKHEPEPKSKSVRTQPRQKKVWPFIFHSVDEQ